MAVALYFLSLQDVVNKRISLSFLSGSQHFCGIIVVTRDGSIFLLSLIEIDRWLLPYIRDGLQ